MTILIITHRDDNPSVEQVREAVEARGDRAWRFDTDRYPTEIKLSVSEGRDAPRATLEGPDGTLHLDEVTAVWWRRTHTGRDIPRDMERQMRAACVEESKRSLAGTLAALDAFTVDPMPVIRRAENKPLQLKVARALGLDVPRTLTSNDPAAVRAFAATCPGGMITKMMASFAIYDEDGREHVVFTNPVSDDHLADLDGLSLCPMTFQEKLEKRVELRVTVVGDRVFTASIDSQRASRAKHDWRREGSALLGEWRHYELPDDVAQRLLRYMDHFGLTYGAADFIVTPEGRHVFLECNPAGEWFWLQVSPGLPIAEAMADVLTGRAPHRGGLW
ncbi:MAG: MvdD family ATP-grasp ribosomal peptide maturase [Polyangiales bacterium]